VGVEDEETLERVPEETEEDGVVRVEVEAPPGPLGWHRRAEQRRGMSSGEGTAEHREGEEREQQSTERERRGGTTEHREGEERGNNRAQRGRGERRGQMRTAEKRGEGIGSEEDWEGREGHKPSLSFSCVVIIRRGSCCPISCVAVAIAIISPSLFTLTSSCPSCPSSSCPSSDGDPSSCSNRLLLLLRLSRGSTPIGSCSRHVGGMWGCSVCGGSVGGLNIHGSNVMD
jgi:hypothetical protein